MEKQRQEEEGKEGNDGTTLPLDSNNAPTPQIRAKINQLEPDAVLPGGGNELSDGKPGDAVSAMRGNGRSYKELNNSGNLTTAGTSPPFLAPRARFDDGRVLRVLPATTSWRDGSRDSASGDLRVFSLTPTLRNSPSLQHTLTWPRPYLSSLLFCCRCYVSEWWQ